MMVARRDSSLTSIYNLVKWWRRYDDIWWKLLLLLLKR